MYFFYSIVVLPYTQEWNEEPHRRTQPCGRSSPRGGHFELPHRGHSYHIFCIVPASVYSFSSHFPPSLSRTSLVVAQVSRLPKPQSIPLCRQSYTKKGCPNSGRPPIGAVQPDSFNGFLNACQLWRGVIIISNAKICRVGVVHVSRVVTGLITRRIRGASTIM